MNWRAAEFDVRKRPAESISESLATAKTLLEMIAGMLQVSRKTFWTLQECCKRREKLFGLCRNAANATKNFLASAGMLQMLRKTFWSLQKCCKCREKLFGVCRNAANAAKNLLEFAGTLQVLRKTVWRLQHRCKHFQKHFSRYNALSETSYWNKKVHPFVEHTFRRGVESKTKRIPQAYRHF